MRGILAIGCATDLIQQVESLLNGSAAARILAAGSGSEALDRIRMSCVDVIMLSIGTPDMD